MPKQLIPFKGWYPGYKGSPPTGAGGPVYVTEEEYGALQPPTTPAPTPTPTPTPTPSGGVNEPVTIGDIAYPSQQWYDDHVTAKGLQAING